jgi:hypothetical protein
MPHDIKIRGEMPSDHPAVRKVNVLAFGRIQEADRVDRILPK